MTEAVIIYRKFISQHPASYQHHLAQCLSALAIILHKLGHRESALRASTEAIEHYEQAVKRDARRFTSQLSQALGIHARLLGVANFRTALKSLRRSWSLNRQML